MKVLFLMSIVLGLYSVSAKANECRKPTYSHFLKVMAQKERGYVFAYALSNDKCEWFDIYSIKACKQFSRKQSKRSQRIAEYPCYVFNGICLAPREVYSRQELQKFKCFN